MTSKRNWAIQGAAIMLVIALSHTALATPVTFTVDTTGTNFGATPLSPLVAGNAGKYAAGSFLSLGGSISAVASGISASGTFGAQKAATGAFSTGGPSSLLAYYGGTLAVDVTNSSVSFTGGSSLNGINFNAKYPEVAAAAVPLSPMIGGGPNTTTPGSDPAVYGVSIKLLAFGVLTAANGTSSLRNLTTDITNAAGPVALVGAPGTQTFTTAKTIGIGITSGNIDYNLKGSVILGNTVPDLFGTGSIAGGPVGVTTGGNAGTLTRTTVDASRQIYNYTITVPVTSTITNVITGSTPATILITTTGQIAAYANNVQVPEPATLALAGFAAVPLAFAAWRRRKRA